MSETVVNNTQSEVWAVIELTGHARTAGRLSQTNAYSGLIRVDVPTSNSEFRTEYYGQAAIYSIKIVSEEIARAFATPQRDAYAYDDPVIPRDMYENAMRRMRSENEFLSRHIRELQHRLTAVDDLPRLSYTEEHGEPTLDDDEGEYDEDRE